ncbi:MAG: FG-GAP repeat domain-containing protein [Anaerolineales bacterium]
MYKKISICDQTMVKFYRLLLLFISIFLVLINAPFNVSAEPSSVVESVFLPLVQQNHNSSGIVSPVLKWQYGGCYTSWCETGWYSSPAIIDLDGDGGNEVLGSAYSIVAMDGETGGLIWRTASGHDRSQPGASNSGRTWPGIVVADVDGDHSNEIVTAHGGGYVSVYDLNGYFAPGWPQQPTGGNELRGLSVSDLDADGTLEIITTGAVYGKVNTWVYEHNGQLRNGWPQLGNDSGYAYGIFNDNAAVGDLDGDGYSELVVPSDVHYICAYERNGAQIPASASYGTKGWGKVGVWESLAVEQRGWGTCDASDGRSERYRANFAHGPAVIADVDQNGTKEVIATGNVYDCAYGSYPSRYTGVFLFNADRSRYQNGLYDWRQAPVDTGAPLSEDYNQIENAQPNPVTVDLDGDGLLEVLFASYDGRLHAFWLDKTEHGSWPYAVNQPSEGIYRFASEPAIADLNADGKAEVIFASWVEKGSGASGQLHILNYLGQPVYEVDLPAAYSGDWNGALAAPTLGNIDDDPDLEVVLNTAHSGFVAYDLPGTSGAEILWGTGRGNFWRNGNYP